MYSGNKELLQLKAGNATTYPTTREDNPRITQLKRDITPASGAFFSFSTKSKGKLYIIGKAKFIKPDLMKKAKSKAKDF